jgi:hypothetical protein
MVDWGGRKDSEHKRLQGRRGEGATGKKDATTAGSGPSAEPGAQRILPLSLSEVGQDAMCHALCALRQG